MTVVLFTCAGQRVDIVRAFRDAGADTLATDIDPLAPALYHADRKALVPRIEDPGYVAALAALVGDHDTATPSAVPPDAHDRRCHRVGHPPDRGLLLLSANDHSVPVLVLLIVPCLGSAYSLAICKSL